jgi:hypothetical protein
MKRHILCRWSNNVPASNKQKGIRTQKNKIYEKMNECNVVIAFSDEQWRLSQITTYKNFKCNGIDQSKSTITHKHEQMQLRPNEKLLDGTSTFSSPSQWISHFIANPNFPYPRDRPISCTLDLTITII